METCKNIMVNIVLVEPEIPQNTGNIARTCAVTGSRLHIVKPLGFDISDKAVKRAGLDYWHLLDIKIYRNIRSFLRLMAIIMASNHQGSADIRTPCLKTVLYPFREGNGGTSCRNA